MSTREGTGRTLDLGDKFWTQALSYSRIKECKMIVLSLRTQNMTFSFLYP